MAMQAYPGSTILDRTTEGYLFFQNYFSDLGRTVTYGRQPNMESHQLFVKAMVVTSITLTFFFLVIPTLFKKTSTKSLAIFAAIFGIISAICYSGIAIYPLNGGYYGMHTLFVRVGFISFLLMSLLYSIAIKTSDIYPNRYAYIFWLFCIVLAIQICIMLLGPRSWSSPFALSLQVIAQKIVVYGEILCMFIQCIGAFGVAGRLQRV